MDNENKADIGFVSGCISIFISMVSNYSEHPKTGLVFLAVGVLSFGVSNVYQKIDMNKLNQKLVEKDTELEKERNETYKKDAYISKLVQQSAKIDMKATKVEKQLAELKKILNDHNEDDLVVLQKMLLQKLNEKNQGR